MQAVKKCFRELRAGNARCYGAVTPDVSGFQCGLSIFIQAFLFPVNGRANNSASRLHESNVVSEARAVPSREDVGVIEISIDEELQRSPLETLSGLTNSFQTSSSLVGAEKRHQNRIGRSAGRSALQLLHLPAGLFSATHYRAGQKQDTTCNRPRS